MDKIASPMELQSELRKLLEYASTPNPSRVKLAADLASLASRVARNEENEGQRAIYHAWDIWSGLDRTPERQSFMWIIGDLETALAISGSDSAERLSDKLNRKLNGFERQTYSWRGAVNLWHEGKITDESLDRPRLKRDLAKSLKNVQDVAKLVAKAESEAKELGYEDEYAKAVKIIREAENAFNKAIRAV
jgi:hypothetical protein